MGDKQPPTFSITIDGDTAFIHSVGSWRLRSVISINPAVFEVSDRTKKATIDASQIQDIDTAGAMYLLKLGRSIVKDDGDVSIVHASESIQNIINLVRSQSPKI